METRVLPLFTVILLRYLHGVFSDTSVEVTIPVNPVVIGGILAIRCQIWNKGTDDTVTILHTRDGQSKRITTGEFVIPSSPQASRVFLSMRTFPDGSEVYFLTLIEVNEHDYGEYTCTLSSWSTGSFIEIEKHSRVIEVVSFPDKTQPTCTSNPSTLALKENDLIELTCATYLTVPIVNLRWRSLQTYEFIPSVNATRLDTVSSILRIRTNIEHNGAVFICEMSSKSFPDRIQTCQIGPITVDRTSQIGTALSTFRPTNPETKDVAPTEVPHQTSNCNNTCPDTSITVFYLTISTFATCLLTILFLITTIVMCCKHQHASSRINSTREADIQSQMLDPNYVSLQRRTTNDQVYMTLEDPNNPEGKVLLPKEVFDEFYNRTLNLRKT